MVQSRWTPEYISQGLNIGIPIVSSEFYISMVYRSLLHALPVLPATAHGRIKPRPKPETTNPEPQVEPRRCWQCAVAFRAGPSYKVCSKAFGFRDGPYCI